MKEESGETDTNVTYPTLSRNPSLLRAIRCGNLVVHSRVVLRNIAVWSRCSDEAVVISDGFLSDHASAACLGRLYSTAESSGTLDS